MKKLFCLSLVVLFAFVANVLAEGTYSGGDGSAGNPFLIADACDMQEIGANSSDWNANFLLVNDINLAEFTGTQFNIIGNYSTVFSGVFDGNDHVIRILVN